MDRPTSLRFTSLINAYLKGDWKEAVRFLKELEAMKVRDGPTDALRKFIIEECGEQKPVGWKGYRTLYLD